MSSYQSIRKWQAAARFCSVSFYLCLLFGLGGSILGFLRAKDVLDSPLMGLSAEELRQHIDFALATSVIGRSLAVVAAVGWIVSSVGLSRAKRDLEARRNRANSREY